jgi:DNA-binding transcriptional LysR family regulator
VVAEYLSFRRAANVLGVRQSAVSRRVQELEDDIGVSLFERHRAGVRITNAGARFLQDAREALVQLDEAVRTAGAAGSGLTGRLKVGILSSMGAGYLRDLMQAYCAQHPDVALHWLEGTAAEHIAAIRKRQLDIAFIIDTADTTGCELTRLWHERIFVVLPKDHPLRKHKRIRWCDLRDEHLIVRRSERDPALCNRLTRRLTNGKETPDVEPQDVGRENLMHLVALGRGVALTSEATAATPYPDVAFRPIIGANEVLQFCAAWLGHNDNPALRRLLSLARTMAKDRQGAQSAGSTQSGSAARTATVLSIVFSARSQEGTVCGHDAREHRTNELRRLQCLSVLTRQPLCIRDKIAMNCGRQLHGKLDRLVVRDAGEFELKH